MWPFPRPGRFLFSSNGMALLCYAESAVKGYDDAVQGGGSVAIAYML